MCADSSPQPRRAMKDTASGLVFVVDDDTMLCEVQQRWLEDEGHEVRVMHDGESCITALTTAVPDAICLDLTMPGMGGLETLRRVHAHHPWLPILVTTAHTGVATAVEAMKSGAWDYFVKPVDRGKLVTAIRHAIENAQMRVRIRQLEREADGRGFQGIIGNAPRMKALFRQLDRIALSDITVLIQGESGTGKELVARAIHQESSRRDGHLMPLNCAAIPESLQESELFGHEKGAFTGAASRRLGAFERANNGTLFLDEIGELSASLQAKLLRVLQEHAFQRVGGSSEITSDFRLVVATHRDLEHEVREGRFREDLYFRIAVMELEVPPLRERPTDIPALAEHFLTNIAAKLGVAAIEMIPSTLETLIAYSWPGNVRELENALERAAVESGGAALRPTHLPPRIQSGRPVKRDTPRDDAPEPSQPRAPAVTGAKTLEALERDAIASAMARHDGNLTRVVQELGIGRTTLYRKLKKYRLR